MVLPKVGRPWSAEERARRTLLRHLSKEQKVTFKKYGYFEVEVQPWTYWSGMPMPAATYRVYTTEAAKKLDVHHYGSYRLWRIGPEISEGYAVYARKENRGSYSLNLEKRRGTYIPECDALLSMKLLLETFPGRVIVGCSVSYPTSVLNKGRKAKDANS